MIIELPLRELPRRTFVSLCSVLTWLLFDHSMDLSELLDLTETHGISDEMLRDTLTSEWRDIADYACKGSIVMRGCASGDPTDVPLTLEDLRNCQFVGWESPDFLAVDPFPFSFSGGFQSRGYPTLRGFTSVDVSRAGAIEWKKERTRRQRTRKQPDFVGAEAMLNAELSVEEKRVGLKDKYVRRLATEFHLPRYQAVKVWTAAARANGIPLRGRPKNSKRKLEMISNP